MGLKGSTVEATGLGKSAREELSMCGHAPTDYALCCQGFDGLAQVLEKDLLT